MTALTALNIDKNTGLGEAEEAEAFPAALRGMTALRALDLRACNLRAVPSVLGSLQGLAALYIGDNNFGLAGPPHHGFPAEFPVKASLEFLGITSSKLPSVPPAILSSMPRLKELYIGGNNLTSLPEDFGRRLVALRIVTLDVCEFTAVPVAALAGATALEEINLKRNNELQVEQPLDALLENHPRLRLVKMWKRRGHSWSGDSTAYLADFSAKLRARSPEARVELLSPRT